jgi:hypothetical protein
MGGMDEREYREQPVVRPSGQWMIPSDRMVLRRYKRLKHFEDILDDGFRAAKADTYEKLEGRASPPTREYEQRNSNLKGNITLQNGSEPDFAESMYETRKAARHYYLLNCWRMGTEEEHEIWKRYAAIDQEGTEGVAVETTVGKLLQHLQPDDDLHMGVVWYQKRQAEMTPTSPPYSLYFFKDQDYEEDKEFRVVANRGGNPVNFIDGREWMEDMLPEDVRERDSVNLDGDLDSIVNKILVAPGSGEETTEEVGDLLSRHSIDADVEPSQLEDEMSFSGEYMSDLIGPANYSGSQEKLNSIVDEWVESTDWGEWSTVDVAQINQKENRHPRRTLVELYRYRGSGPDFEVYGQDHLKYQVITNRFTEAEHVCEFKNDWAEKFEERHS